MISILDKDQQLNQWDWRDNRDDDWFKANIPFFESPDRELDKTYYYRWELVTKHMIYGSPQTGYNFTEFIGRPGWSGQYGSISCPLGLQLYEVRWLKDRRLSQDFARYWFGAPGAQPRSYSNWYGDALWASFLVSGDRAFITSLLPSMEAQYDGWVREHFDAQHGLFHWDSMHDGMEFTIGSRQTQREFDGADSYRPTLNSYLYGDLRAMAKTATLAGETGKAADFEALAAALKTRVQEELWDARRGFFLSQFAHDEEKNGFVVKAKSRMYETGQFAGNSHGRELSGLVPWMFDLPDKNRGFEVAWKGVTDPAVFLAPHGLYFAERNDPLFLVKQSRCWWSGNNWPYANAQTLQAMANVLNDYPQNVVSSADYWKVFKLYADSQRKDGLPYIAETSDPDTGRWTQDAVQMSEHYFHSSFNDLLITGLVGLRPRADNILEINPLAPREWDYFALDDVSYHGHNLSIVWDKTGRKYGRGQGFLVFVDGKKLAGAPQLSKISATLPAIPPQQPPTPATRVNFAVNNEESYFPHIHVSQAARNDTPAPDSPAQNSEAQKLVDGNFYYDFPRPLNRWTTAESPGARVWAEIDFGIARPLDTVKLFVLDDASALSPSPIRAPAAIELQFWNGTGWQTIAGQKRAPLRPQGHRANVFTFPTQNIARLRAIFTPQNGAPLGLSEIEAWGTATLPLATPPEPLRNLARQGKVSASFTSRFDRNENVNDGHTDTGAQGGRWTAFESPNASDWVQLDWEAPQTLSRTELYLWNDDGNVRLPRSLRLQWWDGRNWQNITETTREPAQPAANIANEIRFTPIQTTKLRVTFDHALPAKSGLAEWLVWGQ